MAGATGTTDASRILIVSHDVVGQRMAGPGIRYWEIARALSADHAVTLIAPQPIDRADPLFTCGSYSWGDASSLRRWVEAADAVLANGFVLEAHPELGRAGRPLALDLYDPTLLESLEFNRVAAEQERDARSLQQIVLLNRQLAAGDFFLCATERQRDLYIGALMAAGRVTSRSTDDDPLLRSLIDVVPFGLPSSPPARQGPGLRGVLSGLGKDDLLLLWTGGLWDWLDPQLLVRAMPELLAAQPRARLVFLAGRHPGPVPEMRAPAEARQAAQELGLLDRQVFFVDQWVPYERRADMLLDADLAVSLHREQLELRYAAVRSRFLDHLWAALPSVVSGGDAAAELVERHGLGRVVPPQDLPALVSALVELLGRPAERQECASRARALAAEWRWEQVLRPLARWARAPGRRLERTMDDQHQPSALSGAAAAPQRRSSGLELSALLAELEQHWEVPSAELLAGLPVQQRLPLLALLKLLQPVYAQQRQVNGALIRALYCFSEETQALGRDLRALARRPDGRPAEGGLLQQILDRLADQELATTELARELSSLRGP